MRFLHDLPIKRKLTLITMLTCLVALLMACVVFVTYDQFAFRRTMEQNLTILTDIYGENVAAALAFKDPRTIGKTLHSLDANPHILAAGVYDKTGHTVAKYQRADLKGLFPLPPVTQVEVFGSSFERDRLDGFRRIRLGGEALGTVYITSDLDELKERLLRHVLIVGAVLLASFLTAFLLATRLRGVISDPVFHLAETAARVAFEKDYGLRAVKHGDDELGGLVDRFNEMLEQIQQQDRALHDINDNLEFRVRERTWELQQEIVERQRTQVELTAAQQRLLETSRLAGMAEVATSVLHNVGNVLNSVGVSAEVVAERVRQLRIGKLKIVATLLRTHASNLSGFLASDPRGRELPDYLLQLTEHLAGPQKEILREMESLRKNLGHIREIVLMQQSFARKTDVLETISAAELVEDALRINLASLNRQGVRVVRETAKVPPLVTDRHKALQILVNLVSNSNHALQQAAEKQLTVRVKPNGFQGVTIAVVDNGIGIEPDNLVRIFQHGFTTKKDGHGFGLHSGALAAKELGGVLTAHSDGPGRGAVFTLELPLRNSQKNQCILPA